VSQLAYGPLSYLVLACASALVGYYFARKRTAYEVGYRHRVEVSEGVQGMVLPLVEIEGSIDGLEKYLAQHELWLDRRSSAAIGGLISGFRAKGSMLDLLPRRYDDPGFERAYARAEADLEAWLRTDLPAAREELADAFRGMLGIKRWRRSENKPPKT
jgi:hypothetical protein